MVHGIQGSSPSFNDPTPGGGYQDALADWNSAVSDFQEFINGGCSEPQLYNNGADELGDCIGSYQSVRGSPGSLSDNWYNEFPGLAGILPLTSGVPPTLDEMMLVVNEMNRMGPPPQPQG